MLGSGHRKTIFGRSVEVTWQVAAGMTLVTPSCPSTFLKTRFPSKPVLYPAASLWGFRV